MTRRRPACRRSPRIRAGWADGRWLALTLTAALAAAGPAAAASISEQEVATAQRVATSYWGQTPCAGEVAITWRAALPVLGAQAVARWMVGDPPQDCAIAFLQRRDWHWRWPRFCTVMVHEYGHLLGHQHEEGDVMVATYAGAIAPCSTAP